MVEINMVITSSVIEKFYSNNYTR